MVPTAAGKALHAHATLILNEAARARAEVKAVTAGTRGELVIGIAAMFADHMIDRVVARLAGGSDSSRPGIVVTQGFLEDLLESLREGRTDIVFANLSDGALESDLRFEPLLQVHA